MNSRGEGGEWVIRVLGGCWGRDGAEGGLAASWVGGTYNIKNIVRDVNVVKALMGGRGSVIRERGNSGRKNNGLSLVAC